MREENYIKEWRHIPQEARPRVRYWLPAAAVCEEDLKEEIRQLSVRGFGGVEITALTKIKDILTGEDGWGTENWDRMVQVIGNVTKELDMALDITNGPKWPLSMPGIEDPNDPAAARELTYGVIECPEDGIYRGPVPERRVVRECGKERIVHVMAYLQSQEKVLKQESYQNLDSFVNGTDSGAELECSLPPAALGEKWLIFAFYEQPTAETLESGDYYIIDHIGKAGVEACEKYWTPFMERCGELPSMESIFCDSMEYRASLDWTVGFEEEFEKRRGYSIKPYLPFVGCAEGYPTPDAPGYQMEYKSISDMVNHDYLETLTQCYCEYHLAGLERMAQKYGKTLRYQVAYNKAFEIERSALCVTIPENEALGGPSLDRQKWMASAAHLGRKKRYSFLNVLQNI